MGMIKNPGRETNWSAKEIREVPMATGDTSPVPGTLVRRDAYGNIEGHPPVDENTDIPMLPNTQYTVIKVIGKSQHIVTTDVNGVSSDLAILKPIGTSFRLGFTGDTAFIEIKKVG